MREKFNEEEILARDDYSNFQYAGLFLLFLATVLFIIIFVVVLVWADDIYGRTLGWEWESVWFVIINLLAVIMGFIVVFIVYKRRFFPVVMMITTLMLAASIVDVLWAFSYLMIITFVVMLVATLMIGKGQKEFISPRLMRERKAITHVTRDQERAPSPWGAQEHPYVPGEGRPKVVGGKSCPNCQGQVLHDTIICPDCGVDVRNMERVLQVEEAYNNHKISWDQYLRLMKKLKK